MSTTSPQYKYEVGDSVWIRQGDDGWEIGVVEDRRVRESDGEPCYKLDLGTRFYPEFRCKPVALEGPVIELGKKKP